MFLLLFLTLILGFQQPVVAAARDVSGLRDAEMIDSSVAFAVAGCLDDLDKDDPELEEMAGLCEKMGDITVRDGATTGLARTLDKRERCFRSRSVSGRFATTPRAPSATAGRVAPAVLPTGMFGCSCPFLLATSPSLSGSSPRSDTLFFDSLLGGAEDALFGDEEMVDFRGGAACSDVSAEDAEVLRLTSRERKPKRGRDDVSQEYFRDEGTSRYAGRARVYSPE